MNITRELKEKFTKQTGWRDIVRILKKDISGDKRVLNGLTEIKGIDRSMAHSLLRVTDIPKDKFIGKLTDEEIEKIEAIAEDPISKGIPEWQVNRQRDPETGENRHLTGSDWRLQVKMDIRNMKKIASWKGWRHTLGLPVRGQRTKTTGRSGQVVGYIKERKKRRETERKKGGEE
ncbi:MAG: 30S ribosomal protein S13 [Candidatus Korarchaeota archaeon]|nr:30S ribosomal protein S13 [Candidatus Korarchaeota archaeon]NIU84611.1 30S ribosomal protein S13 [Candidatus Thorarchaeota archaeon]NIW12753.1 30S ribosomal protein S13 [Candidatus Thorarchaeota archaeon]NIW50961.1 30S ribosomal protein S13 [Candidatus Korarchaeota archaeon]